MTVEVLDLILIAILGYWAWRAARNGFVEESLSAVGLVLAVFATLYFGPKAAETVRHSISPGWIATILGYGVVFLVVLLAVTVITRGLSGKVKRSTLGPLDGVLGAVFGILKGLIVFALIYLALSFVVSPRHYPNWVTNARLYPVIQKTGEFLASLVPESDLRRHIAPADKASVAPAAKSQLRAEGDGDSQPPPPPARAAAKPTVKHHAAVEAGGAAAPAVRPSPRETASQKQHTAKQRKPGYGAKDREALDRLIEENGKGDNGKP